MNISRLSIHLTSLNSRLASRYKMAAQAALIKGADIMTNQLEILNKITAMYDNKQISLQQFRNATDRVEIACIDHEVSDEVTQKIEQMKRKARNL